MCSKERNSAYQFQEDTQNMWEKERVKQPQVLPWFEAEALSYGKALFCAAKNIQLEQCEKIKQKQKQEKL